MKPEERTIMYRGFEITVKSSLTCYGVLYSCYNNYGEPRMNDYAYHSAEEAIEEEKKELDLCIDQ